MRFVVCAPGLVFVLVGCERLELPRLSEPVLTVDDLPVLSAALDGVVRKPRQEYRERRSLPALPPIVVSDRTLRSCEPPKPFDLYECVWNADADWFKRMPGAVNAFQERNQASLTVLGDLGSDVIMMPDSQLYELMRTRKLVAHLTEKYGAGTQVVQLSAPIYPRAREALVYVRVWADRASVVLLTFNGRDWHMTSSLGNWIS